MEKVQLCNKTISSSVYSEEENIEQNRGWALSPFADISAKNNIILMPSLSTSTCQSTALIPQESYSLPASIQGLVCLYQQPVWIQNCSLPWTELKRYYIYDSPISGLCIYLRTYYKYGGFIYASCIHLKLIS